MTRAAAAGGLQFGDDDEFEFETLGFVNGHELHAALTAGRGVGQGGQFFKGCTEDGTEQVLFAAGQAVETTPEKIEIGKGIGVDAACAAQVEPDLLQPGSKRGRGQSGPQGGTDSIEFKTRVAARRPPSLIRSRRSVSNSGMGRTRTLSSSALTSLWRSSRRQAAPWGAQHAKPCNAVLRIEQGATKRQRIENFGAVFHCSSSMARKGMCAARNAAAMGSSALRARPEHGDAVLAVLATKMVARRASLIWSCLPRMRQQSPGPGKHELLPFLVHAEDLRPCPSGFEGQIRGADRSGDEVQAVFRAQGSSAQNLLLLVLLEAKTSSNTSLNRWTSAGVVRKLAVRGTKSKTKELLSRISSPIAFTRGRVQRRRRERVDGLHGVAHDEAGAAGCSGHAAMRRERS